MSEKNLDRFWQLADVHDRREGLLAYDRYHQVMRRIADRYGYPLYRIVAAFVSLSPNNDYKGNLRSLISMLEGIEKRMPVGKITTATYAHCAERAYAYLRGDRSFLECTKGKKILNFYHNIIDPSDPDWVTIDGHMVAAYRNDPTMTMRQAIIRERRLYGEIADALKAIASRNHVRPNQVQATIWFARKRLHRSRFTPQGELENWANGDLWKTDYALEEIKPYPRSNSIAPPGSSLRSPSRAALPRTKYDGSANQYLMFPLLVESDDRQST